MHYPKPLLILLLVLASSAAGLAQTVQTVDSLTTHYQGCLDKGVGMPGCSMVFYNQLDSLLNTAYARLRATLRPAGQAKLQAEQQRWLQQRKVYFSRAHQKSQPPAAGKRPAVGSQDTVMFEYDDKASFVKARVLTLVKRLGNR